MPSFSPHQSTSLAQDAQGKPSGFPACGYAQKPSWAVHLGYPGWESLPLSAAPGSTPNAALSSVAAMTSSLAAPSHHSASSTFGPPASATSHGGK